MAVAISRIRDLIIKHIHYLHPLASGNISSGNSFFSAILYNTLTTPRAGQFQVILRDRSKVWFNSENSLRYSTAWQREYFHFTNEDIEKVFLQLERWYDVEVV
ncbi:MAG TPA: DUF4974 domain-containing protein [Patescibacteria group bacterium]